MEESQELEVHESSAPRVVGGIPYFDQYLMLAEKISRTSMVPTTLRGKPEEVLAVVMYGAELGIGPMQAMQQINFIEGKPAVSPELMRALIRKAGHKLEITQTALMCVIVGARGDTGEVGQAEFTLADAVLAGLCSVDVDGNVRARSNSGKALPWEKYTKDMLLARATSRIARALFSDVIAGMSYTPEEVWSFSAPEIELEPLASEDDVERLKAALALLNPAEAEKVKAQWKEALIPPLDRGVTESQLNQIFEIIAALVDEDVVEGEIVENPVREFEYAPEDERF